MLTVKGNQCDMQGGFRLTVNPERQGPIFEAQGCTMFNGIIVCSDSKEEIEQWCVDNDVTLPAEEEL